MDKSRADPDYSAYPFNLPFMRSIENLDIRGNVTFLTGENGSGKSTLLEAMAINYGFNPEGGSRNLNFSSRDTHSMLYDRVIVIKGYKRPSDGFFFRAESFYNVASELDSLDVVTPGLFNSYGKKSLHEQSHGESFLSLFLNRFGGNGLYILDEPESALSPQSQLSFLSIMGEKVKKNSQFIIATHSPIISAFPRAQIYALTDKGVEETSYKETEIYALTRDFLNDPDAFIKHLLD